jgi:alkylation response protein AidB-like acyl-CoA dehydrogenase
VDFALNQDQQAFAESTRELLEHHFAAAEVRALYDDADGPAHSEKLWSTISEHGWLAIIVEPEFGGLGLGLVDAQIVARSLGAGTIPGPWLTTTLSIEAIRLAGDSAHHARWLPGLASGALIGTQALDQQVTLEGAHASGQLTRVEYGGIASLLVVTDRDGRIGVLELDDPGVQVHPQPQYDLSTRFVTVDLADVPATMLPGGTTFAGGTTDVVDQLLRRAAVLTAADLVGLARESLSRTIAYDKQRVQFGRPVGSFQAIKHELANLHVAVTMAEHAVLYAAHALDVGLPDADLAVAVAKSTASTAAKDATGAMIQLTGGIAFTWEHEAHHYYKRAKRLAASFGDAAHHRERIAQLVLDRGETR